MAPSFMGRANPPTLQRAEQGSRWHRFTSTYADGEWTDTNVAGSAVGRLKSATLKTAITELDGAGYDIHVFPDNHDHINIQSP